MSAELLNGYSDMSEVFEIESDEEEVTIKPYEVDCLPNDYYRNSKPCNYNAKTHQM